MIRIFRPERRRRVEHDLGAADVREQRLERPVDDELHADGRGEVHDDVDVLHELDDRAVVEDRSRARAGTAARASRCSTLRTEPVDRSSIARTSSPRAMRPIREVGSDEAGAAGDEVPHAGRSPSAGRHHRSGAFGRVRSAMPDRSGPLRVLQVVTRMNVGGPARHVLALSAALRARGFDTLARLRDPGAGRGRAPPGPRRAVLPGRVPAPPARPAPRTSERSPTSRA